MGRELRNFLATDRVPKTLFGVPVVADKEEYTEDDIRFFMRNPEAGGYYDLGRGGALSQGDVDGGDVDDYRYIDDRPSFLATDDVPETLFGVPVVASQESYTEADVRFFEEHPEAGGYYDLGAGSPDDGTAEGAPVQDDEPGWFYGTRNDGSLKGPGWLGALRLPDGGVATEYSVGTEMDGAEVEIPTLVPSLTRSDVDLMVTDIIPNHKEVPESIFRKAVAFAIEQRKKGAPVFRPSAASEFFGNNPTLFDHVKKHEKLSLTPYKDVGGYAYGYGTHLDLGDALVTATTAPLASEAHAQSLLMRDLYRRRLKLSRMLPGWRSMPVAARQALLDVAMGRDDILDETNSGGLYADLRLARNDRDKLLAAVKKHYYSYRKSDNPEAQAALERRRVAGGRAFFGEDFSYEGKVWDAKRGFVPAPKPAAKKSSSQTSARAKRRK